jgi:peptide/nickel transport system substrate-binding protein
MALPGWGTRAAVLAAGGALVLAACGGGDSGGGEATDAAGGGEGQQGGTLYVLSVGEQIQHLDPQRNYTGEDLAFTGAFITRTLTNYKFSEDPEEANQIVGDLAVDTGTPNDDATEWSFELRDDATWEDGSPVTCEDVKYGVSRTFAQDVITDGPQYAVSMLDIPTVEGYIADGDDEDTTADESSGSAYAGPYVEQNRIFQDPELTQPFPNDTAAFDQAVSCDGNTITFKLNKTVADFNYTVTLQAFSPVKEDADTGEQYTDAPLSNGPYKIEEYTKGQQLVLVRNENWDSEADPLRPAYPDRIVYQFALEGSAIDQRVIADAGDDQFALGNPGGLQPSNVPQVFAEDPRFTDRRWDEFDPYVQYIAINTSKVPNQKHRQAILAAMNRENILTVLGGEFAGSEGDGIIKPNLALDYAPTGLWEGLLGQEIPAQGDPEFAQQLIEESGEPMPELVYDYPETETRGKEAAAFIEAMTAAGITVTPNPIESGTYYGTVLDPEVQNHLSWGGWGPDWANASTVIPELYGALGGFNLSQYNAGGVEDADYEAAIQDALSTLDREEQATKWQELNKRGSELALVAPTVFGQDQRLWGSKLGGVYFWAPFGSYSYADIYVEQ